MLLLGLREPYAAGHPEEVLQRVEHPADFRPLLVPGPGRQRRIDRRHVLVFALQDDGEQVGRMVVEEPAVVALQPVVDPDGKPEQDERPPYQVGVFRIAEPFGPPHLEELRKPPRVRRPGSHHFSFPEIGALGWIRTRGP